MLFGVVRHGIFLVGVDLQVCHYSAFFSALGRGRHAGLPLRLFGVRIGAGQTRRSAPTLIWCPHWGGADTQVCPYAYLVSALGRGRHAGLPLRLFGVVWPPE